MLACKKYDLIISDLVMPGMSGIDFVRQVADMKKDQKAIIMTGHGDVDTFIESVHGLGALEYIIKPIDTDSFVNMVKKLISSPQNVEKSA
jgi:DNA-binding NtrC family response regulator